MEREQKSERSRRRILESGLQLFAKQGFRATTVREIAEAASLSIGNVYHHFPDKQAIFTELLSEYSAALASKRFPFARTLETTRFPDNIEQLGYAARDSVRLFRSQIALVYVDMIEFEGTHMREFYAGMARLFETFLANSQDGAGIASRLRPGISATSALLMVWRMYFNYFMIQTLFGVEEPFGKDSNAVVKEIADVLRNGFCA